MSTLTPPSFPPPFAPLPPSPAAPDPSTPSKAPPRRGRGRSPDPSPASPPTLEALTHRIDLLTEQLSALTTLLHLELAPHPTDPRQVQARHRDVVALVALHTLPIGEVPPLDVGEVHTWTDFLLRLTPSYFNLVMQVTGDPLCWHPYVRLTEIALQSFSTTALEEHRLVHLKTLSARRSVLQAAYLFARFQGQPQLPPDPELDPTLDTAVLRMMSYLRSTHVGAQRHR